MSLKKLFVLLAVPLIFWCFYGCEKHQESSQDPYLDLSRDSYTISSDGGEVGFFIYASHYWDYTIRYDSNSSGWITSATSNPYHGYGSSQGSHFIMNVASNNGQTRSAVISLHLTEYGLQKNFLLVQEGNGSGGGSTQISAPTNLQATVTGANVTLSWNSVSGASQYNVYHSLGFPNSLTHWGITKNTLSTYKANTNGTYYFAVTAVDSQGIESSQSNTVSCTVSGVSTKPEKPSKPTGLKANVNGSQVNVSWNPSTGASYYRLYYVKPAPYDIESFDNIYSTSTTMNCTIKGTWTIWVVAVNSDYEASDPSSKVTFNISSSGGSGSDTPTQLDRPTGLQVNSHATDSYVQLQCNAVKLGYDYQLYRSTSSSYGYTKISASVGSNANGSIIYFTDSNPRSGTTYYKVKVAALSYLGIKDSEFSDYVKVVR